MLCKTPGKLPDGTEIPCRKCSHCAEQRVTDWVGRCYAESKTAVATNSLTLTYGRDEQGNSDHFRAAWLTYSDMQKYFKRLRRDGYQFRYLVAGEYGSTKGRAHWHAIMFWAGKVPPHKLTTSDHDKHFWHDEYWPHGHQIWKKAHEKSVRYVCKYIQKDVGKEEQQAIFRMSKKPPIGHDFFRQLAMRYVEAGLAPQDMTYSFPEVKGKDGKPRKFYMGETTLRNYLETYKALWRRHKGGWHPQSDLIDWHDDRMNPFDLRSEQLKEQAEKWQRENELNAEAERYAKYMTLAEYIESRQQAARERGEYWAQTPLPSTHRASKRS